MSHWLYEEAKYLLRRTHKIRAGDLAAAPRFLALTAVSNLCFGELDRAAMREAYPSRPYGEGTSIDASLLKRTADPRRSVPVDDVEDRVVVDQPFVSRLAGRDSDPAFVGFPTPLALAPDGRIVREVAKNNRTQINAALDQLFPVEWISVRRQLERGQLSAAAHVGGDVLPLVQRKYPNFYHWLLDELPKLRAVEHRPDDVTVIVDGDPPSYVTESLDRLGFPNYRQVDGTPMTVDGMLVPTSRNLDHLNMSYVTEEDIAWLRERGTRGVADASGGRRVYVSRENTSTRRVLNRDELLVALRERGFESYVLEERSFAENVELFVNAELVVGPHGAGLANTLFSDDVDVVELSTLAPPPQHFFFLARQAGHGYHHVSCRPAGDAEFDIERDMYVDVDEVVRVLESRLD